MPHPSFDLFHQLSAVEFDDSNLQLLQALKDNVNQARVWIPGRQTPAADRQIATCLHLRHLMANVAPVLPLYVNRDDAIAQCGEEGFFAGTIQMAIGFAEAERIDADLQDGYQALRLSHDRLLEIRDMVGLGEPGVPMSDNEVLRQREAIMSFATSARHYCARQPDVETLHLATLTTSGIKPMLVASLSAARYETHASALTALSRQWFLPAWRFLLLDHGKERITLMNELMTMRACYQKRQPRAWWSAILARFGKPKVERIELTLTR